MYYDFDVAMSKRLLTEVTVELEKIGVQIVSVVLDLGGKNGTVWKELGVSHVHPSFKNPFNASRTVWVFADAPHLFKLLRNHFIDDGIHLASGTVISAEWREGTLTARDRTDNVLTSPHNTFLKHLQEQLNIARLKNKKKLNSLNW